MVASESSDWHDGLLPGTTIVQVCHCLVDGLHNSRHSGIGCHVDCVQIVIASNEDDVGISWVSITMVCIQVSLSLQQARMADTGFKMGPVKRCSDLPVAVCLAVRSSPRYVSTDP